MCHCKMANTFKITDLMVIWAKKGSRGQFDPKFFSSKDAPGSKLSFDGKKSRVPGKKSRVPGQKPHFLTYLVQNGVRGSI